MNKTAFYGLMAEFDEPEELSAAVDEARKQGYTKLDAYSPFPIEGLAEKAGIQPTRISMIVLLGGLGGGITGYLMQYYAAVIAYPLNIGGKPLHSWAAFIPVTFEMTVLGAAFAAVFGMLGLNGLPMPYHPVFNVPRFEMASKNRFFICIESRDPKFDRESTRTFLERLKPRGVYDVEP